MNNDKNSNIIVELEDLTNEILFEHDMLKIPVDVVKIADDLGIEIYETELKKEISGAISYDSKNKKFSILLNKKNSTKRKRFTIAHELGHYFLHKNILENDEIHIDIMYRDDSKNYEEKKVDYFAGALLMNKMLLEKLYNKTDSIAELSEIFDVSESAMTVRLNILGLLK